MSMLQVEQLSLRKLGKILCRELSFTIQATEIWGILGINGSGKTTLLHTLLGLQHPDAGRVTLNGRQVTSLSALEIAQTAGLLFQESRFPLAQTVWDYCLAGRFPHQNRSSTETNRRYADDALATAHLTDAKIRCITTLSGGEKRRLAIAKLLTQDPDFYLLDEPTNHLDINYQHLFMQHFQALAAQGRAILASLHDINIASRYCSHVLLLFNNGRYLTGRTQDILTMDNVTTLYQQSMTCLRQNNMVYWVPASTSITHKRQHEQSRKETHHAN